MYLKKPSGNVYLIAIAANLASFVTGTVLSWSSSQLTKLSKLEDNPLGRVVTDSESGWLGALPSIGGIIGPFIYGFIMEKLGKRPAIQFIGIPLITGYIMIAFGKNIYVYLVARLICGIGAAGSFLGVNMYLAEISKASQRGLLVSSTTAFIVLGILFSYCMGPYTSILAFNLTLAVWALAFILLFTMIAPESPYYLVTKNRCAEAEEVLITLRKDKTVVDQEIEDIKNAVSNFTEQGTILDLFKGRAATLATIIGVSLVVLQQFSGINVILAYTEQIFAETKSSLTAAQSSIVVGVVQFASSPITPILSDRFGRKILLLSSTAGCFLTQESLGTFFYLKDHGRDVSSVSWFPIVCLVLFIIFFNCGFAGLPWTVISEVFPNNIKSVGSSTASISYWTTGFLLTYFFNEITSGLGGMGPVFWVFGSVCLFSCLFIFFILPETKGRSLGEIQDVLAGN